MEYLGTHAPIKTTESDLHGHGIVHAEDVRSDNVRQVSRDGFPTSRLTVIMILIEAAIYLKVALEHNGC